MKKCLACNNMVDDNFAFCPHCGQKMIIDDNKDASNSNKAGDAKPDDNPGAKDAPVKDTTDENPLEYNPELGGGQTQDFDNEQSEYAEDTTEENDTIDTFPEENEPLGYEMKLIEEEDEANVKNKNNGNKSKKWWIILLLLLLAGGGAAAYFFLNKDNDKMEEIMGNGGDSEVTKKTPDEKLPQADEENSNDEDGMLEEKEEQVERGVAKSDEDIDKTKKDISDNVNKNGSATKRDLQKIQNFEKKKINPDPKDSKADKKKAKKMEKDLKKKEKKQKKKR